jgi:hypothetical protein
MQKQKNRSKQKPFYRKVFNYVKLNYPIYGLGVNVKYAGMKNGHSKKWGYNFYAKKTLIHENFEFREASKRTSFFRKNYFPHLWSRFAQLK